MSLTPLPTILYADTVRLALAEDLGRVGDLTTSAIIGSGVQADFKVVARQAGTIAGQEVAREAFRLVGADVTYTSAVSDGSRVIAGQEVANISGPAASILTAERVALNFLGHLSGVATETTKLVDAVVGTGTAITCTRKTTPGLRALEKFAVRCGGGKNHRFGLDDAVLIKDNHIAVAGGITAAVRSVRAAVGHLVAIEVEVDTMDQLRELLTSPVDVVMLDNMAPAMLREAVAVVDGRMTIEASGNVTLSTVRDIAKTGVDTISAGWITHSAPTLDLGLDAVSD
ncbi:carboxylating nicotinate-nucleotide diphosphorylase [Ornithinimicrobium sp. Arc0846-15]|nr:carboxylating nicotinate-nucleotide diphosphorylase [Ornithinimicrobium laminariae]